MSRVRQAVTRAREAEAAAGELDAGAERTMLEQIAALWREIAQHRMLSEMSRRRR